MSQPRCNYCQIQTTRGWSLNLKIICKMSGTVLDDRYVSKLSWRYPLTSYKCCIRDVVGLGQWQHCTKANTEVPNNQGMSSLCLFSGVFGSLGSKHPLITFWITLIHKESLLNKNKLTCFPIVQCCAELRWGELRWCASISIIAVSPNNGWLSGRSSGATPAPPSIFVFRGWGGWVPATTHQQSFYNYYMKLSKLELI